MDETPPFGPVLRDASLSLTGMFDQAVDPLAGLVDDNGMVNVTIVTPLPRNRWHALLWRLARVPGFGWVPFRTIPVTRQLKVHRDNIDIEIHDAEA